MNRRTREMSGRRSMHGCAALILALCALASAQGTRAAVAPDAKTRLPTGAWLDTAGRWFDVGNMPLAMLPSPDGRYMIVSLSGWREQGIEVVELTTGRVVQRLAQPAAFLGLAFSPDARTLYVSGGNEDAVFRYDWNDGHLTPAGKLALAEKE